MPGNMNESPVYLDNIPQSGGTPGYGNTVTSFEDISDLQPAPIQSGGGKSKRKLKNKQKNNKSKKRRVRRSKGRRTKHCRCKVCRCKTCKCNKKNRRKSKRKNKSKRKR